MEKNHIQAIHLNTRRQAKITGVMFITATITAIVATVLYVPVLQADFVVQNHVQRNLYIAGGVVELLTVCSIVGTAIMLYPYLKQYSASLAIGYVGFRCLEAILVLLGTLSVFVLTSLNTTSNDSLSVVESFQSFHNWNAILGPNFMLGINTFIYSWIFLNKKLIPKNLALLGIIGAVLIFFVSILRIFHLTDDWSPLVLIMAFPVFIYEILLAVRLLTKGFNS